jgi:hypothetical protein
MGERIRDREGRHARIVGSAADTSGVRIACIAAVAAVLAGCGGDRSESLPAACTEGPEAVVKALAKAPGAVTLDGTPISHCFNRDANGDDVQIVGTSLLAAAQQLADRGDALQLGYLVGAARRGAKRNGLGAELVRRLEAEASNLGTRQAAYRRGLRAGLAQG